MNNTKYEAVVPSIGRSATTLNFKVFNQFATILMLTYETLQFGLGRYAVAVSKPTERRR